MKLPSRPIPLGAALLGVVLLGLAACDGASDEADQRTALGQILPGSTSDTMIPYDQLRSQPPLAPPTGAASQAGRDAGRGASDAATDAPAPEAEATAESSPAEPASPDAEAT